MSARLQNTLHIELSPKCDESGNLDYIAAKIEVGGLNGGLTGGRPGNKDEASFVLTKPYPDNTTENDVVRDVKATDEAGGLGLRLEGTGVDQSWHLDRQAQGTITIRLEAHAIAQHEQSQASASLSKYGHGLVGVGASFLPIPTRPGTFDLSLTWDLQHAQEGIRAVTSFGEGSVSTSVTAEALSNCVFMVGQVGSYPPTPTRGYVTSFCGTFWLGDLPSNLDALKPFTSDMFPHLSNFFNDESGTYRAFITKASHGLRGTTFASSRSSLIEYDDDAKDATDWELVRILNKSMIASWVNLDPEDDGTRNDWFREGLSHLYTIYLPYRFKQRSPDYFRATVNGYFTSYFTNPHINMSLEDLKVNATENQLRSTWHMESLLPMRACIYMIRTDAFSRRSVRAREQGVERPIDGIVADIVSRKRRGELVQEKDWIKLVGEWIGQEAAEQALQGMKSGKTMDLEDMKTGFGGIDAVEMNVMDMGFDRVNFDTGIISGVAEKSPATEAGLRNEDRVLWHSKLSRCEVDCNAELTLKVQRNRQAITVTYVPRGSRVVKGWLSIKKDAK